MGYFKDKVIKTIESLESRVTDINNAALAAFTNVNNTNSSLSSLQYEIFAVILFVYLLFTNKAKIQLPDLFLNKCPSCIAIFKNW